MTKCNELLFILLLLVSKSIVCEKRLNAESFNDTRSVCHNYDIQSEAIREELNKKNSTGILFNENDVFNTLRLNANHTNEGVDGNFVYAKSSEIVISNHGKRTVEGVLVDLDRLKIKKYYTNLNSSDCRISILKRRGNLRIPRNTIYMMRSFDRILELLDILSSRRECPYCKGCNDIRLGSLPIWVSPIFQKQLKRINYELDYKLCYILKKDLRVYNEIKETILKLRDNFWDVEKNGNKRTLYDLSPIEDSTIEIIRKNNMRSFNVSILGIILEVKFDDLKLVGSKLNHCVPLQFLFKCSWHPNKQSKDILSKLNFVSNIMFDISNSLEINVRIDNVDGTKTRTKTGVDIYDYKYDVNIEDEININSNMNFDNNTHFGSNNNKESEVRNGNAGNNVKNIVSGLDLFYIQFGNPNITNFEDVFIPNRSKTKGSAFSKSSFTHSFSNKNSNLFGYREHSSVSDSLPSASSHSATISSSLSSSSPSSSTSSESSSYSVNSLLISSNKCISPFLDTMVVPKEGFLGNGELQICDFELGANLDDGGEIANSVKDKRSSGLKEGNTKTNNFGEKKATGPYNDYESQYYDDDEDEYSEKLRVVHGIQYVHHIAAIQYDYASSSSNSKLLAWGDGIMHPKSVQSSNPDSYLLVPCNKPMWFIIGFQEDIFLEFISIFSLEYFSSSYKDIEISGSLVYPTKNWVSIGILRRNEKLSKEMFDMKPSCMREEETDEGRRRERTFGDVNYIGGSNLNEKKKSDIIKENINTKSGQNEYKESTLNGYKNKKQKKYNLQNVEKKPDGKRSDNSNNIKNVVKDGDSLGSDGEKYEYPFSSTYSYSHSYSNPCWVRYIRVRALSNFEEGHYYCHLSRIQIFGNNIMNKLEAEINGKRNSILIRGDGEESVKEVENRLLKRDPNIINGNIQDQKDDPDHRNNDNTHDRRNDNGNKVDVVGNNGIEASNGNQNGYLNSNNHYYSPHYNHIDNKVNTDNYGRSQNYNGKQENTPEAEAAYGDGVNTGNVDNNEFLGVNSNYGSDNNRDRNIKRNQQKKQKEEAFSYNEKNRYRYAYNNNEFENEMYPNMDFYRTQDINYRNNHPLLSFVEKVKMLEKKINLLKMENRAILSELNSTTSYLTESMIKLSDSIKFLQDVLMLDSNYNITSVGEDVRVSDKTGINRGVIGRVGAINKNNNIGSGLNRGIRFDNIGIAFKNTLNQYYDNYFNIECLIKVLKNINSLILMILRYIIDNITILVLLLLIVTLVTSQVFLYKQLFSVKKRLQNTLQFIKSYSNNSTPTAKNSKGGVILDDPFSFQKNTKLHSNPVGINSIRGFNGQTSVNSGTKPQNNHTNYIAPSVVSIPSSTIENSTATICGAKVGVNPNNSTGGNKGSGNEFGANFDPSYIVKDLRDSHCESDDCNCVLPTENNQVSANTSIGDNNNPGSFVTKTEYEKAFGEGEDQKIKEELPEGGDSGEVGGEAKNNAKCNYFSVFANEVQKNDDINSIQSSS